MASWTPEQEVDIEHDDPPPRPGIWQSAICALPAFPPRSDFYRRFLSALLPPACRFQPSCSAYALEAIHSHGPLSGLWLAIKRVARCHPIAWLGGGSGFDPVPPSRHRQP